MELVAYIENKIKAPDCPAELIAQQGEQQPVTRKESHMAINMLKNMNDNMGQESLEEARRTRDV
eukprot:6223200-Heterocapsa_arctica.AAC.1